MARKFSIFRYIVINNPSQAMALAKAYDNTGRIITSEKQLVSALKRISKGGNAEFAEKILAIHPDRKLFDALNSKEIKKATTEIKESYVNLVTDAPKVELTEEEKKKAQQTDTKITNIAIGALIGLGVTIAIVGLVRMVAPKS